MPPFDLKPFDFDAFFPALLAGTGTADIEETAAGMIIAVVDSFIVVLPAWS